MIEVHTQCKKANAMVWFHTNLTNETELANSHNDFVQSYSYNSLLELVLATKSQIGWYNCVCVCVRTAAGARYCKR